MKKEKERLYIAYGSNLNLPQMERRCPGASVVGTSEVKGYELLFRGVATIEPREDASVPVLLWKISPQNERALDRYEGWPQLYRKEMLRLTLNGKRVYAMVYIMNEAHHPYGAPATGYFDTIREGYESANFDTRILYDAVSYSKEAAK